MIEREIRENVTIVRIRHGKANAMDVDLLNTLGATFGELEDSPGAIVLTGHGTIFSAGLDLIRLVDEDPAYFGALVPALTQAFSRAFRIERPVVAAVNGHAIAGGCILAAAADYRLMARGEGTIGVPELLVGVPFPAFALEILRFTMAPHRLQEAVYTGRTYAPEEARGVGLVDEVVDADALVDRAVEVASSLARIPARSFALVKRQLRQPVADLLARHGERIDNEVEDVWRSEEIRRSIGAYVEKVIRRREGRSEA